MDALARVNGVGELGSSGVLFWIGGRWMDGWVDGGKDGWMGGGGGREGISDESEWLCGSWHHGSPDGNGCVAGQGSGKAMDE